MVKKSRFQIVLSEGSRKILKDLETGVLYLFYLGGIYAGGLTVLVDQDGKPLIDKGSNKNCTKCGRENADSHKFCSGCGTALTNN